jgi:hypothetical protein
MMTFCEALQIVTEHEQLLSEGPEDNIDFATKVHGGGGKTTKAAIARGDITRDQMAPMPGDKIGYHPIWNRERSEHLPSTEDQGSMELEPSIVGSDVPLQNLPYARQASSEVCSGQPYERRSDDQQFDGGRHSGDSSANLPGSHYSLEPKGDEHSASQPK